MNEFTIFEPEFIDLAKTKVRFKLSTGNGVTTIAELNVPSNRERGVNPHWDYILDNFDVEDMRRRRNEAEIRKNRLQEFHNKKKEAKEENDKLVALFNKKMKLFNLPFVANADSDIKSAIRRSPDQQFLDFIYTELLRKHMTDNNMTYAELLDYIEEANENKTQ